MDTTTMDFIYKIFNYICPAASALLAIIITQVFYLLNDNNNKKWEKQKNHRDFQIETIRNRKEQIEVFIKKFTAYIYNALADISYLKFLTNQEDLNIFYSKIRKYEDDDRNETDKELLMITYTSVVRSVGDEKLTSLLDQIFIMFDDIVEFYQKYFLYTPDISSVMSDVTLIEEKVGEYREKYNDLSVEFFKRLDKVYLESDPFKES